MVGRAALSIVGGSRSRATLGFIAELIIIRECGDGALLHPCGALRLGSGQAPPRHHTTSIRGNPARNAVARHFTVNLKDSRHRTGPGKSLRLLIAALFHLRAQYWIKQHSLQTPPDLKHVFRIHQYRRAPCNFRQARRIRSDHRSSVGHRFEWWQPKSLVKGWKDKNLGYIIKNAQHFDGHESQETHVVLHAAPHHGASQPRMARKIVSDDDELQIRKLLLLLKLALQCRKRFDDANHILVWPDRTRIQNE